MTTDYWLKRNIKNKEVLEFQIKPKSKLVTFLFAVEMALIIFTLAFVIIPNYGQFKTLAKDSIALKSTEINYNNNEFNNITSYVNNEITQYFNITPPTPIVVYMNTSYLRSYATRQFPLIDGGKIAIGVYGIEDYFKYIYTHEYFHQVAYEFGLKNNALNEALTEVYATYTNPDSAHKLWGENSEGRDPPYDIILKRINQKCLNDVFSKRMNDIDEYVERIQKYCDVSLLSIINDL
jgi:hypothetical protein